MIDVTPFVVRPNLPRPGHEGCSCVIADATLVVMGPCETSAECSCREFDGVRCATFEQLAKVFYMDGV
jgi:hypothetical protein